MMQSKGLTIVEVLIAIVILSLTMTLLAGAIVSSLRSDAQSGQRTQAAQVLNAIGRQVVEGASGVIPVVGASETNWAYGELKNTFSEMVAKGDFANPDVYRAKVERSATPISLAGVTVSQYNVEVCWQGPDSESCIAGFTAGPNQPKAFIGN